MCLLLTELTSCERGQQEEPLFLHSATFVNEFITTNKCLIIAFDITVVGKFVLRFLAQGKASFMFLGTILFLRSFVVTYHKMVV